MPSTQRGIPAEVESETRLAVAGIPDWSRVESDVLCPRCAYNLCTLTGSRCPECGLDLDWPAIVTASARQVHVPLFEYQWRQRPIRSLLQSMVMAVTPWRTWKMIPLTAEPRIGPLIVQPILALVMAIPLTILTTLVVQFGIAVLEPGGKLSDVPRNVFWVIYWVGSEFVLQLLTGLSIYFLLSLFQQTLSRQNVRSGHLFRITVFVMMILSVRFIASIFFNPLLYLPLSHSISHLTDPVAAAHLVWDFVWLGLMTWTLASALRDYLRIPHPWSLSFSIVSVTMLAWSPFAIVRKFPTGTWSSSLILQLESEWSGLAHLINNVLGL